MVQNQKSKLFYSLSMSIAAAATLGLSGCNVEVGPATSSGVGSTWDNDPFFHNHDWDHSDWHNHHNDHDNDDHHHSSGHHDNDNHHSSGHHDNDNHHSNHNDHDSDDHHHSGGGGHHNDHDSDDHHGGHGGGHHHDQAANVIKATIDASSLNKKAFALNNGQAKAQFVTAPNETIKLYVKAKAAKAGALLTLRQVETKQDAVKLKFCSAGACDAGKTNDWTLVINNDQSSYLQQEGTKNIGDVDAESAKALRDAAQKAVDVCKEAGLI